MPATPGAATADMTTPSSPMDTSVGSLPLERAPHPVACVFLLQPPFQHRLRRHLLHPLGGRDPPLLPASGTSRRPRPIGPRRWFHPPRLGCFEVLDLPHLRLPLAHPLETPPWPHPHPPVPHPGSAGENRLPSRSSLNSPPARRLFGVLLPRGELPADDPNGHHRLTPQACSSLTDSCICSLQLPPIAKFPS